MTQYRVLVAAAFLSVLCGTPALGQGGDPQFSVEVIDPAGSGDCKMLGDLSGDGQLDAVIGGSPGEDLAWYASPLWERTVIAQAGTEFSTDGTLADVDGDGDLDVVVPDGWSGENLHWFCNPRPHADPSDGTAWQRMTIGAGGSWIKDLEAGDFNGDGRVDIAARSSSAVYLFVQGIPGSWDRVTLELGLGGEGMAAGDVDGDGDPDLVLPGWWLENPEPAADAAGAPWPRRDIDAGVCQEAKVLVADFGGAVGRAVVFSCSESTGPVRLYHPLAGDPRGPWAPRDVLVSIYRCHTLQAGDMDRDGDTDLVIAQMHTTPEGEVSVLYNEGGAAAWRQAVIGTGGIHNGVVGDLEGDGDLDIFGANWTGHPPARLWRSGPRRRPADIDGGGTLDTFDVLLFFTQWMGGGGGGLMDFDGSGEVNPADASEFLKAWLTEVP